MSDAPFKRPMWQDGLKAIAFDVQGTCADFYQPVLRAGAAINRSRGLSIDWAEVSAEWRDIYRTTLDDVIAGQRPWMRVDHIYREALDILLQRAALHSRSRSGTNSTPSGHSSIRGRTRSKG